MNTERLRRFAPGRALAAERRGPGLRRDLLAGVVLAALLVPQGMGYAQLAGLPPVTGLYATLIPLVAYFLLGPSRILIISPDSICARVQELAEADSTRWVVIAAEPITDIDATAAETLADLQADLDAEGRTLAFAELKDPV